MNNSKSKKVVSVGSPVKDYMRVSDKRCITIGS